MTPMSQKDACHTQSDGTPRESLASVNAGRAPAKICTVIAPKDSMQRIATLAFSILAREYRDKQARGNVDDKTPGRRVDRKGPTTPRQFHKEAVEEDQSWWFRKYDEQ